MKPVSLSRRLQAVTAMVTVDSRVCDVGCDHGFVPVYLIEQGISPRVLAMDVKSGPLNAARRHVAERGLEEAIQTRLSDGLHNYNIGEADTLICAGMGGRLMMRILADDSVKTESFRELILQPQSEIEQFRRWLRIQGYCIADENMIEEDGKFYPIMRVEMNAAAQGAGGCTYAEICGQLRDRRLCDRAVTFGEMKGAEMQSCAEVEPKINNTCDYIGDVSEDFELCKLIDRYGPYLLLYRNGTLQVYLEREEKICRGILDELQAQGLSDAKRQDRYMEVKEKLEGSRMALEMITE